MADYVAILKKTIDGLGTNTPEVRKKVYEKARVSISSKIAAIQPPPPQAAVDKQMSILEKAISDVEADYELNDIAVSLDRPGNGSANKAEPVKPAPAPVSELPMAKNGFSGVSGAKNGKDGRPDLAGDKKPASPAGAPASGDRPAQTASLPRTGRKSRAIPALLALVLLGAAGFGAYAYRDNLRTYFASVSGQTGTQTETAATPAPAEDKPAEAPAAPATEDVAAAPATPEVEPAAPAAPAGTAQTPAGETAAPATPAEPKLTQRLMPDGTEVDEGGAGGAPGVGEGTSVAAATQPSAPEGTAPPSDQPAASAGSLPIGQKAIFYEERTNAAEGSALQGNVVWSTVQESPGNNLPPEPAVQAEVTIPDLELSLRMTIRRNADTTLPASHIIELVFITPEGFAGGSIDEVQRVTFKSTEQAPGNPLVALPAKIADGFFLVALNDASSALDTNLTLLRREPWIDIPVTYKTGRRALITMEKGIPGDKVFDEVLKAWDAKKPSATGAPGNG